MIVSDYSQMDRILREEKQYILDICKKIKKAGCNVLMIQKSILRYLTNVKVCVNSLIINIIMQRFCQRLGSPFPGQNEDSCCKRH